MADDNVLENRVSADLAADTTAFDAAFSRADKTVADWAKRTEAAFARFNAANDKASSAAQKFQATINQSLGVRDDFGAEKRTKDIEAYGRALDNLRAKHSPLFAAQREYKRELGEINRALSVGAINQNEYTAAVQRTKDAFANQVRQINGIGPALTAGAQRFRGFGGAVQQVGFQVGDFATQVASGSGVIRPFIQQGTQLVSMFGPWGAAIGAAGAVVGALAVTFLDLGENTDEARKAAETYEGTLKSLQAVIDELDGKGKTRIERLREEVAEQKQLVRVEIAKTQALVDQARVRLELAQLSDPETAFGVGNAELERIKQLQKVVDEAQKRVDKLDEKYMEAANSIYNDEQVEATRKAVEDLTKAEEKRLEVIRQYDLDRVHQQENDRAAAFERGKRIIEEDARERQKALEKEAAEREKIEERATKDRQDAWNKYNREIERTTDRTLDHIAEASGDILFDYMEGRAGNFWETFARLGKRALAQLVAEQVTQSLFRPFVSGAVSSLPGMFGISGSTPGSGQIAGSASSPGGFDLLSMGSKFIPTEWFGNIGSKITSGINSFGASYLGLNSAAATQAAASTYGISAGQAAALSNAGAVGSTATLSSLLGGAGLGFGAGQLLRQFTDNKAISGGGGALAGAGVGFMMGGPVGAAVGALAGLLGGVMGGGKSVGPNASALAYAQNGRLVFHDAAADNGGDLQGVINGMNQVIQAANGLADRYGLNIVGQGAVTNLGSGDAARGDRNMSAEESLHWLIRNMRFQSSDPVMQQIIGRSGPVDPKTFEANLAFGELYKSVTQLSRAVNDNRDAIEASSKAYDDNAAKASSLGLSGEAFRAGMAANENQALDWAIQQILDPVGYALDRQAEAAQARLDFVTKIGADIAKAEQLNMLERQRILEQSGANLKQWLENQIIGPTSALTGSGRLAEAQKQFGEAVASARVGTGGIGDVTQLGDIILGMSKDMFGGTKQNALLVELVRSTIANLGKELGYPGFADGTTSAPSGWAWVGERGPELVKFRGGEQVMPAEQSAQMARSQAVSSAMMADDMQSLRREFGRLVTSIDGLHRDFRKILNKQQAA